MVAFPCDFRVGSTGFGIIGGIGAGVGFLSPLQLGGIPAFGQIAGALVGSLSRVDSALGHPVSQGKAMLRASLSWHSHRQCPEVSVHPGKRWDSKVSSQRP